MGSWKAGNHRNGSVLEGATRRGGSQAHESEEESPYFDFRSPYNNYIFSVSNCFAVFNVNTNTDILLDLFWRILTKMETTNWQSRTLIQSLRNRRRRILHPTMTRVKGAAILTRMGCQILWCALFAYSLYICLLIYLCKIQTLPEDDPSQPHDNRIIREEPHNYDNSCDGE